MTEQEADLERRHVMELEQTGARETARVAAEEQRKRLQNPEFLAQLQEADLDSDLWDWIEDELGPITSGAHILGDRGEYYEGQQEFLNRNKAARMKAERTPGRLLRENPLLLALAQGIRGTEEWPDPRHNPAYRAPMTSRKRRVIDDAIEVATSRQTLAIGGRGIDAVASATVENRSVTRESKDESRAASAAKEVFR